MNIKTDYNNVKFILQLLLGFVLILIAVYSLLNEDGRVQRVL